MSGDGRCGSVNGSGSIPDGDDCNGRSVFTCKSIATFVEEESTADGINPL